MAYTVEEVINKLELNTQSTHDSDIIANVLYITRVIHNVDFGFKTKTDLKGKCIVGKIHTDIDDMVFWKTTPREKDYDVAVHRPISWDRLSELATELLYGSFEAEPYETVEFCREHDLSETEISYLVADCHKKYFEEKEG